MSFRLRSTAALAPFFLLVSATGLAAQYRLPPDSVVRRIIDEQVGPKHTVGLVIGLLDADGTRRVLTAGKADNGALQLDANTVFEIGSISKTFTNALLADMVRRGEVTLDQPVQSLLPSTVKVPTRNGKQITLLDLATASSGLPRMPSNFKPKDSGNPFADYTVDLMYQYLNGYTLTRDIGSLYEYSNTGMGLLGHALALRLKKSYFQAIEERVLKPLGMRDTRIELTPDMQPRLALGHDPVGKVVPNWDFTESITAAGSIRSTVADMFKFLAANLDSTSKPLGPTLAVTHGSRRPTTIPNMTIGLAWHILKGPGGTIVWHNGGTGGYRTFLGFDVAKRVGVILLTNSAISADDVAFHLIDSLVPLSKPPTKHAEVAIDASILPRYAGTYQVAPDFALTVTVENGALMVAATGQGKLHAYPESEKDFFVKEVDASITFVMDGGRVTGLVLHQPQGDQTAKRVP